MKDFNTTPAVAADARRPGFRSQQKKRDTGLCWGKSPSLHCSSMDLNVSFTAPVYQLFKGYGQSDKVCVKKIIIIKENYRGGYVFKEK